MNQADIEYLNNLPDNMPDVKLSRNQIDRINLIYHTYINNGKLDTYTCLYKEEQREKWPSGPKVKKHEAQRFILGWLASCNEYYKSMNNKKAASYFFTTLNCRDMNKLLISKIYKETP